MIPNDRSGCSTALPIAMIIQFIIYASFNQWWLEKPWIPPWLLWTMAAVCFVWWLIADIENWMI